MNWLWFLIISLMALPGIIFMSVAERKIVKDMNNPDDQEVPPYVGFLVHLFIVILFAGMGTLLLHKTNFTTPDFNEIKMVTIVVGTVVAIIHLLYYYGIVGTRVEKEVMKKVDTARNQLGIFTRVFYGGIVEEIIFRWGLMSLFVWLGSFFIQDSNILYWMAIVLASILFGLAHQPGAIQILGKNIPIITIYSMSMNILVGVACGWLFWKIGLLAAIVCHMLFHLVWYAYERMSGRLVETHQPPCLKGDRL